MPEYDVVVTSNDGDQTILVQAVHAAGAFQAALNVIFHDWTPTQMHQIRALSLHRPARAQVTPGPGPQLVAREPLAARQGDTAVLERPAPRTRPRRR